MELLSIKQESEQGSYYDYFFIYELAKAMEGLYSANAAR